MDFDVNARDYEIVDTEKHGSFEFIPAETPCYVVTMDDSDSATVRNKYAVAEQSNDFKADDKIIVVGRQEGAKR